MVLALWFRGVQHRSRVECLLRFETMKVTLLTERCDKERLKEFNILGVRMHRAIRLDNNALAQRQRQQLAQYAIVCNPPPDCILQAGMY